MRNAQKTQGAKGAKNADAQMRMNACLFHVFICFYLKVRFNLPCTHINQSGLYQI